MSDPTRPSIPDGYPEGPGHLFETVPKVAAAIIAGDEVPAENWKRLLGSLDGRVDAICVVYNGTKRSDSDLHAELESYTEVSPILLRKKLWRDDFSEQREHSFTLVREETDADWVFWIDTDDELVFAEGQSFQSIIMSLDPNTKGVFFKYRYGVDREVDDTTIVEHWRERLLCLDTEWKWAWPVHEACHGAPGIQYAKRDEAVVIHWREEALTDSKSRERNRRIIEKAIAEHPEEPKHINSLANELHAEITQEYEKGEGDPEKAKMVKALYRKAVPMFTSPDDAYMAQHRIAEVLLLEGKLNEAIDNELQCIKILPTWPDAYVGIARAYLMAGDNGSAVKWADMCLSNAEEPDTTQIIESLNIDYMPNMIKGTALMEMGNFKEADAAFKAAQAAYDSHHVREALEDAEDKLKHAGKKAFYKPVKGEKKIAFLTHPLHEPWHPELAKKGGFGGAETCVMVVAEMFAKEGWSVAVFGTPGEFKGVASDAGVQYWDSSDFDVTEHWNVTVASRCPDAYDANMNADKKLVWLHDVNLGPGVWDGEWGSRVDKVDGIICLTPWHASHTARVYPETAGKLVIVPNGVDLSRFTGISTERQRGRFVYSSSPDRGLPNLLAMWEPLKEKIPEAELHIYYGWDSIDKIVQRIGPNHPQGKFLSSLKGTIIGQIEQHGGEDAGLYWEGRIQQGELAKHFMMADMWLYPTDFLETFCITAIETMAAGMVPITSGVGALQDIVPFKEDFVHGHPSQFEYQNRFIEKVIEVYSRPEADILDYRTKGMATAAEYTWENAFEIWKKVVA